MSKTPLSRVMMPTVFAVTCIIFALLSVSHSTVLEIKDKSETIEENGIPHAVQQEIFGSSGGLSSVNVALISYFLQHRGVYPVVTESRNIFEMEIDTYLAEQNIRPGNDFLLYYYEGDSFVFRVHVFYKGRLIFTYDSAMGVVVDWSRSMEQIALAPSTSSAVEFGGCFESPYFKGRMFTSPPPGGLPPLARDSVEQHGSGIRINYVSFDELAAENIPGIGGKFSRRLVEYREENGPFRSFEDLDRMPGVGEKMLSRLQQVGVDFTVPDTPVVRPKPAPFSPPGGIYPVVSPADDGPRFLKDNTLLIPAKMADAIRKEVPGFRTWDSAPFSYVMNRFEWDSRQMPWGVVGDFNGDGKSDLVIDGFNDTFMVEIVVISDDEDYRIVERSFFRYFDLNWGHVSTFGRSGERFYRLVPPGPVGCPFGISTLSADGRESQDETDTIARLKQDAFESIYLEKASSITYFEEGHWKNCYTSD